MPSVNLALRRYVAEIVYWGPGSSGKTTVLEGLAAALPGTRMVRLEDEGPRTRLFELFSVLVPLEDGWTLQCNLRSLPGAVRHAEARRQHLGDPDAVVFVADSQRWRAGANRVAMDELRALLEGQGRRLEDVPGVLQLNRQDLADLLPWSELQAQLNPGGWPAFASVASERRGIVLPLGAAVEAVRREVQRGFGEGVTAGQG